MTLYDTGDPTTPRRDTPAAYVAWAVFFVLAAVGVWRVLDYAAGTGVVVIMIPADARIAFDGAAPVAPRRQRGEAVSRAVTVRLAYGDHRLRVLLADGGVLEQILPVRRKSAHGWILERGRLVPVR